MAGAASAQTRGASRPDVREQRQDQRQDARQDRRQDQRQAQRWNQRQRNGYYVGNRFYYGQPNASQINRRDYRPAYQQWRRERLRQPPRGYHYVRDDRGEVLMVGIATGVILSILLNN